MLHISGNQNSIFESRDLVTKWYSKLNEIDFIESKLSLDDFISSNFEIANKDNESEILYLSKNPNDYCYYTKQQIRIQYQEYSLKIRQEEENFKLKSYKWFANLPDNKIHYLKHDEFKNQLECYVIVYMKLNKKQLMHLHINANKINSTYSSFFIQGVLKDFSTLISIPKEDRIICSIHNLYNSDYIISNNYWKLWGVNAYPIVYKHQVNYWDTFEYITKEDIDWCNYSNRGSRYWTSGGSRVLRYLPKHKDILNKFEKSISGLALNSSED